MYEGGRGAGFVPVASTSAGVLILPNTGGSIALTVLSILLIAVGGLVIVSTAARFLAKKMFKA